MPSPFPGMDPYLEAGPIFPGLHDRLIFCLGEILQPLLPKPYYAEIGDRVWVEATERAIGPDVTIRGPVSQPQRSPTVAVPPAPGAVLVTVPHDERREPFLELYAGADRLVTTIEILSPVNKAPGSKGRDLYVRKQEELLGSQVHLVELDLLRSGEHTTAVPLERARAQTGPFDYHVCVHRFHRWEQFEVYPNRLRDCLPQVAIPLLPQDRDVLVALQAVFDRAYDAGPYTRRIDYGKSPQPPLSEQDAAWAAALLARKALR